MKCPPCDQNHNEAKYLDRLDAVNTAADAAAIAALVEYAGTSEGIEAVGEQWLVPLLEEKTGKE